MKQGSHENYRKWHLSNAHNNLNILLPWRSLNRVRFEMFLDMNSCSKKSWLSVNLTGSSRPIPLLCCTPKGCNEVILYKPWVMWYEKESLCTRFSISGTAHSYLELPFCKNYMLSSSLIFRVMSRLCFGGCGGGVAFVVRVLWTSVLSLALFQCDSWTDVVLW